MAQFVEFFKNVFSWLSQDLEESMKTLNRKILLLEVPKDDVHETYNHGKKRKRNVEKWLIDVGNNISESKALELYFPKELFLEVNESIDIWMSLMDDSVLSIGIYGMGGIGKTTLAMHVHNKLLKESTFLGHVYWVTVSQEFSIYKLQNDIAHVLKLYFSCENDKRRRAAELFQAFKERGRFVLILDDVWNQIDAEEIGIPLGMNGCKLVITSRSSEVCHWIGCQKIIKVNTLSEQEAWELFLKKLGRVELHPRVEGICKKMVKRCGGLPLALVTLAGSMRRVSDIHEWRDASEGLAESCMGRAGMEYVVLPILLYSYDRLRDTMLKGCFLHCSLYPENCHIPRDELIENFISEQLVERSYRSFRAEIDQGHAILNQLERVCLLEKTSNGTDVKMHVLIRDMAIEITKENPRYMVKAGLHLREIPDIQEWTEDLDKVSLMDNTIMEISPGMSPKCPRLSTLILSGNPLKRIPDCFFVHMCHLRTINLSLTKIQSLPNSISDLEDLRTLKLKFCNELESMPSLEKLKELRHLDLTGTRIEEVPKGMDSLTNLRFLYLRCSKLKVLPTEILHRLSRLKLLSLPIHICVPIEKVEALKKLEVLEGRLNSARDLNRLLKSRQRDKRLSFYRLSLSSKRYRHFDDVHILSCKRAQFEDGSLMESSSRKDGNLLPRDIQELIFDNSGLSSCLMDDFPILNNARDLKSCIIEDEDKLECIMRLSSANEQQSSGAPFQSLEILKLWNLRNFIGLFMWEAAAPLSPFTFFWLKKFKIGDCCKVKKLFPQSLIHNFRNLEELMVFNCVQMEEIIECDKNEGGNSISADITFPRLLILHLRNLPQLKSICRGLIICDSIRHILLEGIKKIKKVPLYLQLLNGQPSPPPSLILIWICREDKEWWESLDWDHQNANSVLERLVRYFDGQWWMAQDQPSNTGYGPVDN
ncbi:probable disease resistance protein At5g63020 [Olea europaea var. sylvestris]|uniref:probable disease resistance protein At5g63020 n=1 Tax=Olea europaea var. sylvestris TaxID=158386 RepID=UPI000C1D78AB|nr:probable disease resistance protein At5g63020 [Olea europaea var. sylvestris]